MSYTSTINGQVHETDIDGNMPLLRVLRDMLELNPDIANAKPV